jgi:hypothetical protein
MTSNNKLINNCFIKNSQKKKTNKNLRGKQKHVQKLKKSVFVFGTKNRSIQ